MSDLLKIDQATYFARQLKSIPGFPWDDDVVTAFALRLIEWCKGAIDGGLVISAESQAKWLVDEACENWEEWKGAVALRQLFRAKYQPERRPELQPFDMGDKPPVVCPSCKDTGTVKAAGKYVWCDCEQGERQAADPSLGQAWLDVMNGKRIARRQSSEPVPAGSVSFEQVEADFRERREQIAREIEQAQATLKDPTATQSAKEIAEVTLLTYRGEKSKKKKRAKREDSRWP